MVGENKNEIGKIYKKMESHYQKVGIVKYDAFHEMGGNLSFVLTMLDETIMDGSSMQCTAGRAVILTSKRS